MKTDQRNLLLAIFGIVAAAILMPTMASAQCTTTYTGGSALTSGLASVAVNMVDIIVQQVANILSNVAEDMYETIIDSPAYKATLAATLILYFTIYGVMLSLGMVQTSANEVVTRFVKVAFIFALLTPGSWNFFHAYVYQFFFGGMVDIIREFNVIGGLDTGGNSGIEAMDNVVGSVLGPVVAALLSQNTIVTLMNTWHVGAMGIFVNIILLWGIVMLLLAIVASLATFIKSMVGLFFLFGLAPIFIICLLFERTKSVFQGWLNQVISFSLQPIFVFAFLGFFVALIFTSLMNIMSVQWCVRPTFEVFQNAIDLYRPNWVPANAGCGTTPSFVSNNWTPVAATCLSTGTLIGFPINLADVFIFVVLSYLAWKYCGYVTMIAQQLSGAMASGIANPAAMGQWMGSAMGGAAVGAGLGVFGMTNWARNRTSGSAADNTEPDTVPRAPVGVQAPSTTPTTQTAQSGQAAPASAAGTGNRAPGAPADNPRFMPQPSIDDQYNRLGQEWKARYGVELDNVGLGYANSLEGVNQKLATMNPSDSRYEILERRRALLDRQLDSYRGPSTNRET